MFAALDYNTLPTVDLANIKAQTIGNTPNALCDLIDDHNLTDRLAIRLFHKHFDLEENELAVFQSINVDDVALGPVVTLSPLSASNITEYIGKHFLFNGDTLVAYEWIANNVGDGVDLSKYPEFTSAFIETLVAGNATEIFGLATISDYDKVLLSEFEIPHLRTTVMVSECLLSPDADTSVIDTNWIVNSKMAITNAHCRKTTNGHSAVSAHCRRATQSGVHSQVSKFEKDQEKLFQLIINHVFDTARK